MYNLRMSAMSVSEARTALHDLLERVAVGEEVTITRHGQPVAVVVRPDVLRARRADSALAAAAAVAETIAAARRSPFPPPAALTAERAQELIAAVRAGRERL
ncbi:MAG: type II toxin-antitoxin system prevent-host-death family antitoxin [Solirubrobacteraceae bacterium]|jgi:antitoxin (DNA-binding transcriptional repressor) of toxin-antitoxin stability system